MKRILEAVWQCCSYLFWPQRRAKDYYVSSKLTQVIEQIPKDVIYDFCCSYAKEHEELAMALVGEFWRPEKDDYRSMVQQCLMQLKAGLNDKKREINKLI